MSIKKLGTSLLFSVVALLIPLSSVFAAGLDTFHWNSSSGLYVSKFYNVTDGSIKICAVVTSNDAVTFKLYEYDPDNADDYITSKALQDGQCYTFTGLSQYEDGSNNAAELYFGTTYSFAGGYITE